MILAGCLVVSSAAGCSTGTVHSFGSITGMAAPCAGIVRPGTTSVTVYVKLHGLGGRIVRSVRVPLIRSPGSRYHLTLPVGSYIVSAPRSGLPARTATVRPHRTTTVNFRPSCK
jgi:hypothetical protein